MSKNSHPGRIPGAWAGAAKAGDGPDIGMRGRNNFGAEPCPHCRRDGVNFLDHEMWCRETVPLAERIRFYCEAMFSIGWSPQAVYGFLTAEERAALKGIA